MLRMRRLWYASSNFHLDSLRYLSMFPATGEVKVFSKGLDGRLSVRLPYSGVILKLRTEWRDSCVLSMFKLAPGSIPGINLEEEAFSTELLETESLSTDGIVITTDDAVGQISVDSKQNKRLDPTNFFLVEAVVPEFFSVDILAARGRVVLTNKLKGNCRIRLGDGDIRVNVVRGQSIRLSTGGGEVVAGELEGNLDITATKVRAELMNGSKVRVNAVGGGSSVTVGGLYSPFASIMSSGKVAVSASHGSIGVSTTGLPGAVELSSITGTAHVSTGEGDVRVHFEELGDGTCNVIKSEKGDIVVTMPTGATADLELMGRAEVLPSTFQGDIYPTKAVGKIVGTALNSRAQEGTHPNRGGGKIALAGAREQCLQNFVPDETRSAGCPHLMISAEEGRIRLESLGWIDNIIRGYTMTHGTTDEEAMDTT